MFDEEVAMGDGDCWVRDRVSTDIDQGDRGLGCVREDLGAEVKELSKFRVASAEDYDA